MFTGIIKEIGQLNSLDDGKIEVACEENKLAQYKTSKKTFEFTYSEFLKGIQIGDSISVNGICLTVTNFAKNRFMADVMPETIKRTSLSELKIGDAVNLERALKVGDSLDGHIVSGHIDGVGKILSIRPEDNALIINVSAENSLLRQIATKGSVALDGISLTVVDAGTESFSVSMIPHTLEVTNFKFKKVGSLVNIETDILAKYIDRLINFKTSPTIDEKFLMENGFM